MLAVVELVWPGLVLAFTLGAVVGFATLGEHRPRRLGRLAITVGAILLVGSLVAAVLQEVPGRAGLWLEVALVLAGTYLAGCAAGALTGRALRRPAAAAPRV